MPARVTDLFDISTYEGESEQLELGGVRVAGQHDSNVTLRCSSPCSLTRLHSEKANDKNLSIDVHASDVCPACPSCHHRHPARRRHLGRLTSTTERHRNIVQYFASCKE